MTMDLPAALFQIRVQALAYAMQTAEKGEPVSQILVRAHLYADFMADPLVTKQASDAMGEPITARVQ